MDKWNAKDYKKNSKNQMKWGLALMKAAKIKKGEKVLDVGCGDGKITVKMVKMAGRGNVTGADSSLKMLKLAKKSFPGVKFVRCDARKMKFADEFDVVFSNACLHWIKEQKKALKSINSALKKGGRMCVQMGGRGNAKLLMNALDRMIEKKEWKRYFKGMKFPWYFQKAGVYKKLLRDTQFRPVNVRMVDKTALHKGRKGLAGWIRTTWLPYTTRVPVNKRDAFISGLVDEFVKKHGIDRKGRVKVIMTRLQAEAVKI